MSEVGEALRIFAGDILSGEAEFVENTGEEGVTREVEEQERRPFRREGLSSSEESD